MPDHEGGRRDEDEEKLTRLSREPAPNLLVETLLFLRETRNFWLAPILFMLLLLGGLATLGGSAAAPLIYALF